MTLSEEKLLCSSRAGSCLWRLARWKEHHFLRGQSYWCKGHGNRGRARRALERGETRGNLAAEEQGRMRKLLEKPNSRFPERAAKFQTEDRQTHWNSCFWLTALKSFSREFWSMSRGSPRGWVFYGARLWVPEGTAEGLEMKKWRWSHGQIEQKDGLSFWNIKC